MTLSLTLASVGALASKEIFHPHPRSLCLQSPSALASSLLAEMIFLNPIVSFPCLQPPVAPHLSHENIVSSLAFCLRPFILIKDFHCQFCADSLGDVITKMSQMLQSHQILGKLSDGTGSAPPLLSLHHLQYLLLPCFPDASFSLPQPPTSCYQIL